MCQQPKSKREDKEAENELHVGGLRRPSQTLLLVPGWETTGRRLWDCIDASLSDDTDASGLTRLYGQADFQGPQAELVEKVQRAIQKEFALGPVLKPRPSFGLPSSVRADILCGVMRAAGDPDANTSRMAGARRTAGHGQKDRNHWCFPACGQARQRRPFANPRCVNRNIPASGQARQDVSEQLTWEWGHYRSVLENPKDAHKEFERCRAARIAVDVDKATLERPFPKGHVNKLGLIVKESPEKLKVRLVVDMRRSRANARAAVPERLVLPRPRDVVADWEELFSEAASLGFTPEAGVSCVNVTCDFSDAYCHVLVHLEEL